MFRNVRAAVRDAIGRAQQPFVYASLGRDPIYLVPPTEQDASAAAVIAAPSQTAPSSLDEAERGWNATKDTTSIAVLEAFITRFAGTFYGDLAQARLGELRVGVVGTDGESSNIKGSEFLQSDVLLVQRLSDTGCWANLTSRHKPPSSVILKQPPYSVCSMRKGKALRKMMSGPQGSFPGV